VSEHADEVRAEAFRSAAIAVDRLLERVGDPVPDEISKTGTAAWDRFRSELARVVDLNLDIVRNTFDLYGSLVGPEAFKPAESSTTLLLGPGVPGAEVAAILWLHNFDEDPMTGVELIGSRLVTEGRSSIERPEWSFAPSTVSVPPGSAVPVTVSVGIPPGTWDGSYEGTITAKGRQGQPIDVRLQVIAMSPVSHASW
jgi:hypothetical protein